MTTPMDYIERRLAEKRAQLMQRILDLVDQTDAVSTHARIVLEARVSQLDLDAVLVDTARRLNDPQR